MEPLSNEEIKQILDNNPKQAIAQYYIRTKCAFASAQKIVFDYQMQHEKLKSFLAGEIC